MGDPIFSMSGQGMFVKNLRQVDDAVQKNVERAILRVAWLISNDAKRLCPVNTGRLRSSTSVNWSGSGKSRGETSGGVKSVAGQAAADRSNDGVGNPGLQGLNKFLAVVGTNVEYAPYVHKWAPYLLAGFTMNREQFREEIVKAVNAGNEKKKTEAVPGGGET